MSSYYVAFVVVLCVIVALAGCSWNNPLYLKPVHTPQGAEQHLMEMAMHRALFEQTGVSYSIFHGFRESRHVYLSPTRLQYDCYLFDCDSSMKVDTVAVIFVPQFEEVRVHQVTNQRLRDLYPEKEVLHLLSFGPIHIQDTIATVDVIDQCLAGKKSPPTVLLCGGGVRYPFIYRNGEWVNVPANSNWQS